MCPFSIFGLVLLVAYALFDVHYYIRVIFAIGWAKYIATKKKSILETSTAYGFCTTNDMDILVQHMNNARFLREMDFARFAFNELTRIYEIITCKQGGGILLGGVNIRFRKIIPIFSTYKIETKIIYWEEKAFYYEQKFITLKDGFVRAVALVKQPILGWDSAQSVADAVAITLSSGEKETEAPPPLTEDLRLWIASVKESSNQMRKKD